MPNIIIRASAGPVSPSHLLWVTLLLWRLNSCQASCIDPWTMDKKNSIFRFRLPCDKSWPCWNLVLFFTCPFNFWVELKACKWSWIY
jgi:hypothetical protein